MPDKEAQLAALCALCRKLGADVRGSPENRYFTATVWDGWDGSAREGPALAIQQKIKEETAQYDGLVCYCFDPYSTLVYAV